MKQKYEIFSIKSKKYCQEKNPNRPPSKLNMPRSEFRAKNLDMEILFPLHYATKTWLSLCEERKNP